MVLTFEGKKLHQWMMAEIAKRLIEQGYEVRMRERIGNYIVDILAIDWEGGGKKYVYEVYVQPQRKVIEKRYYMLKDHIDKMFVVIPDYEDFETILPIEVIKLRVSNNIKRERKESKVIKVPHDIYNKALELKGKIGLPIWKCVVLVAIRDCPDIRGLIGISSHSEPERFNKIEEELEDIREVVYEIKDMLDRLINRY